MTNIRTTQEQLLDDIRYEVEDNKKAQLGQYGSAFQDAGGAITPPDGYVIIAITFLKSIGITALAAEQNGDNESFGLTAGHTGAGSGGVVIDSSNIFPAGLTIYGRWTSVTQAADSAAGFIAYFGK